MSRDPVFPADQETIEQAEATRLKLARRWKKLESAFLGLMASPTYPWAYEGWVERLLAQAELLVEELQELRGVWYELSEREADRISDLFGEAIRAQEKGED